MRFLEAVVALALTVPSFEGITNSVRNDNHAESLRQMRAWIERHPGDPEVPRGLLWMARLRLEDGQEEQAQSLLAKAIALGSGTEWGLQGEKALADIELNRHQFESAIARYDRLASRPDVYWQFVGTQAAEHARAQRRLWFAALVLLAAVVVMIVARASRGVAALWPAPRELIWMLPILTAVALAALAQERPEQHAIWMLAATLVVLLWSEGAWTRAHPTRRRAVAISVSLGELGAVLFAAIVCNGLWDKLVDTIAMRGQ